MNSFIIRMKFSPEDREEIAEILRELAKASRQEPGCVSYIPHWVQGESGMVVMYEQYVDQAAEDEHRKSAHFKQYAVGGLYQKMLERVREDLIAVV